jgi:hypothetical protein
MADYFRKVAYFSIYSKRSQKEPKNRKKPNKIFSSQTKSKDAKIEKFGSFKTKLATLLVATNWLSLYIYNSLLVA